MVQKRKSFQGENKVIYFPLFFFSEQHDEKNWLLISVFPVLFLALPTALSHSRCTTTILKKTLKILTFVFLAERGVLGFDSLLLLGQVVIPVLGCHR